MARFRVSRPAEADLSHILATSAERWGVEAGRRYAIVLAAAMRKVAADPLSPVTRDRTDLLPGIRSLHIRHVRGDDPKAKVKRPAHVLYYRVIAPDLVEIVRVLHERMEPHQHIGSAGKNG
jgi:toxin ParE1/3/4